MKLTSSAKRHKEKLAAKSAKVKANTPKQESILAYGMRAIKIYATEVNLDRAVPDVVDGMKPVQRRNVFAMSNLPSGKLQKAAEVVGVVLGKYHPHGDASVYQALVNMVNAPYPLMYGEGNWGGLLDNAAAMRYCFTGGTRVMTEKGLLKFDTLATRSKIKGSGLADIEFKIKVDTKTKPSYTSHFVDSGMQEIVKVTTTSGYSTTCTPNEPFYVITPEGYRWTEASDLKPGDYLCMKRGTDIKDIKGSHSLPNHVALFLGYMVGDGYMNSNQASLGFNQVSDVTFNDFINVAESTLPEFVDKFKIYKCEPRGYGKLEYNQWDLNSIPARKKLQRLGLIEGTSYTQRVPECVFQGSTQFVKSFLQTLFEADGSVWGAGTSQVCLCSVSLDLLNDVSLLLRNYFGIFGKVSPDTNAWRLVISGADNIYRFKQSVGFRSHEKQSKICINVAAVLGLTGSGGINDIIPFSKELGLGGSKVTRRTNFRNKVATGKLKSKAALLIAERDYYYDKVESVKEAGESQVWDLTVPSNHSFVADGFVVHNTNCKLTRYGELCFDSDYLNKEVTSFVPNYSDTSFEPVTLPVPLPHILLNGGEGIGVGITCVLPSFTVESVVDVLRRLLKGEKLQPDDFAKAMKPNFAYGGQLVKTKENIKAYKAMFNSSEASVMFESPLTIDKDKKTIIIKEWLVNIPKFIDKVRAMPECQETYPISTTEQVIVCKRAYNMAQFEAFASKVRRVTQVKKSFKINVTRRTANIKDGVVDYDVALLSLSVPQLVVTWLRARLETETKSLNYRIGKQELAIKYSKLLIHAAKPANLQIIMRVLQSKGKHIDEYAKAIAKGLKITFDEAKILLELRLRQLTNLDVNTIREKLKEQEAHMSQLQNWMKHPKKKLLIDIEVALAAVQQDKAIQAKSDTQQLKVG